MTSGLVLAAIATATATVALLLSIQEVHFRGLDARVSNVVTGVSEPRATRFKDVAGWFSSIGMRYRRFYADEEVEQLRAIVESSGFNPRRSLPIWIGVKIVSMVSLPIAALLVAEVFGRSLTDLLILGAIGGVIGIMGPRWILLLLKSRFTDAVRKGTPDAIDLLVVCSEAGLGLESAVDRVAEQMSRSNRPMAQVFKDLLDDLRVLPDRREAFDNLGSKSEPLRRFSAILSQSLQYGTPLSKALRAIAEELRQDSLIKLEDRAHKLAAKLTIPMVLFLLPANLVILGGGPFLTLAQAFHISH
jgi:tight adherence protein C